MEIILLEDVTNLGYKGDILKVKDGYGRNYLLPQKKAVLATESAKKRLAEDLKQRAHKLERIKNECLELAEKLKDVKLTVGAKTSSTGKIFGAVGPIQLADAFEKAEQNYQSIMERCRNFDAMIMKDAEKAGGKKYAEICAASYRQVITAHKLFTDKEGNLMFFSKENNSNGCINTVDLTYPSAPLFLIYNPELQKAMMTSIFEYSASGRWNKPFAAHDLGTYPIANGQVYGGDMPIEESGNMVILAAAIAKAEGNANYAKKYWDLLTIWTNYLVEYGQDPENQLCTDDFAGHWAHNANLSVKAIMGIAAYSELAKMLGMNNIAVQYSEIAKKWLQNGKKWQ